MSHLTKMQMKINKISIATRLAKKRGWNVEKVENYKDIFNNSLKNCHVFSERDRVRLLVASDGSVVADPYYMGYEYRAFMQDYAVEFIKEQAIMDNAQCVDRGIVNGERIIEVIGY